jgi:hypothetical protein
VVKVDMYLQSVLFFVTTFTALTRKKKGEEDVTMTMTMMRLLRRKISNQNKNLFILYSTMTSVLRQTAAPSYLPNPQACCVITYEDSDGNDAPVPFFFDKANSALDIAFVNGFNASTSVDGDDQDRYFRGNVMNGGANLVLNLGPNFIAWCENYLGADAGSVVLKENPIVVKANLLAVDREPNNDVALTGETETPISYENAAGSSDNDYYATVLFKKAMVITYRRSGRLYYRGFLTMFGEGNT